MLTVRGTFIDNDTAILIEYGPFSLQINFRIYIFFRGIDEQIG